jgi:UDP-N-acetylglucosamine 2-epimerase
MSQLLFATSDAVDNLLAEGRPAESIFMLGNVMIETLDRVLPRPLESEVPPRPGCESESTSS